MGMSTHIQGIKPPDDKWKKMKAIFDACAEAKIDPPVEVEKFFCGERPNPAGVVTYSLGDAVTQVEPGHPECGFRVDVRKLPKDVVILEFINSW